jgi:hypothetical protein
MAWQEFPEGGRELFRAIKTAGVGEARLLDLFIEQVLPGSIDGGLTEQDLDAYRKPYPTRERPPSDAAVGGSDVAGRQAGRGRCPERTL